MRILWVYSRGHLINKWWTARNGRPHPLCQGAPVASFPCVILCNFSWPAFLTSCVPSAAEFEWRSPRATCPLQSPSNHLLFVYVFQPSDCCIVPLPGVTLTFQSFVAFPDPYYFAKAPLYMKTPVVSGFGRGSRDLGFPTGELALYDAAAYQAVPDAYLLKLETS